MSLPDHVIQCRVVLSAPGSLESLYFPHLELNTVIHTRLLVAFSFAVCTGSALAQTGAPNPAAPTTPTCIKPGHYPGKQASETRKEKWVAEMRTWGSCVKDYVADLRAQIDAKIKLANSTIEDYNTDLKELQDEQRIAETGSAGK